MTTMPTLLQLQRQMQALVLHGDAALLARIADNAQAGVVRRARVYENAYRLRLIEVLGNDFPVLKAHIGTAMFDELAAAYLVDHPSRYCSVRYVGSEYAVWLNAHQGAPHFVQPHWAELAAFEWAQGEVFDAADSDIVVLGDIAVIPFAAWPGLRLQLQPALRFISLYGNAPACVVAHGADESLPRVIRHDEPTMWLLWRRGFDVYWRALESDELSALQSLQGGATFGGVCESLCVWHPDDAVALRAASLLKRWISDELIAHLDIDYGAIPTDQSLS